MTNAIDTFKSLVVTDRSGYGSFETTEVGKPHYDALWSFCVGDDSLSLPDLEIEFTLLDSRKENVDLCESKLQYDLIVEFRDESSGQDYILSTAVYKAIDRLYGSMDIVLASDDEDDDSEPKEPAPTLPLDQAQVLVDKIGSYFKDCGRELTVSTKTEEGTALFDIMCSPSIGDTLDIAGYQFEVTDANEEVTDESDGWSLGEGFVELTEITHGFEVSISTGLFLGQSTEITGVTIDCGDACFEKDAKG